MDQFAGWVGTVSLLASGTAIALWVAGAIYYDVCGETKLGRFIALAWFAGVIALFTFWKPLWQPFSALLGMTAMFLGWWFRQKPRHDRDWDPAVAVLPRAARTGDTVTIENVRNFGYRSLDDFTPRYETRTYHLANLTAVDAIFFNWGSAVMSHPVLVFDFGPDGRVCLSIEVRYQRGQQYLILRSLYHYYELIILVADERDAILRRTKYGPNQEALLYRLVTTPEERRATFLDYVDAINDLYTTPHWYNGFARTAPPRSTACRLPGAVATGGYLSTRGSIGLSTPAAGWTGRCPSRNCDGPPVSTTSRTRPPKTGSGPTSAANWKSKGRPRRTDRR